MPEIVTADALMIGDRVKIETPTGVWFGAVTSTIAAVCIQTRKWFVGAGPDGRDHIELLNMTLMPLASAGDVIVRFDNIAADGLDVDAFIAEVNDYERARAFGDERPATPLIDAALGEMPVSYRKAG